MSTKLEISYEVRAHASLQKDLVFRVDDDSCRALLEILEGIRAGGREVFAILPPLVAAGQPSQRWETYWKRRDADDSRAMVAHPEPNLWVATFAFSDPALAAIVESLKEERPVRLEDLGPVHAFSNLHLTVEIKN